MKRKSFTSNGGLIYKLKKVLVNALKTRKKSSSAIAERPRSAGWVSFSQKWKTGTGRQYFADIIGLSSTTDVG